jgi:hypothetical protein
MSPAPRPTRVMLLETNLDDELDSVRSEIRFLRELLGNFDGIELIAKEVHSRADLEKFLDIARTRRFGTIHIVSHGLAQAREWDIILTRDEPVNLRRRENMALFRDLKADALFLSCCWLGQDRKMLRDLLRKSGAKAVFGYTDVVTDYQAFLVEALYYHLAYGTKARIRYDEMAEILRFTVDYLHIDPDPDALTEPLLVVETTD